MEIKDILGTEGASKAVIRLIDVIANGVGVLAGPWQRRRMAKAEADAQTFLARGQLDIEKMRAEGERELKEIRATINVKALPPAPPSDSEAIDVVFEDLAPAPNLLERAKSRFEYQEAKRQLNVERIAAEAYKNLEDEVSDEPIDDDWIARFFSYAQDITNDRMQELWGKILAGEIKRPSSCSLRTLEILRNISPDEAELFDKLCPHICDDGQIICEQDVFYKASDFKFSMILHLEDCGLILATPLRWEAGNRSSTAYEGEFSFLDKIIKVSSPNKRNGWTLDAYRVSTAGMELRNLRAYKASTKMIEALRERAARDHITMTVIDKPK